MYEFVGTLSQKQGDVREIFFNFYVCCYDDYPISNLTPSNIEMCQEEKETFFNLFKKVRFTLL